MSIHEMLRWKVNDGDLVSLIPRRPGAAPKRSMLLTQDLWELLNSPQGDDEIDDRMGALKADLEVFADGQPLHPKYLFLLSPVRDAVWEIRSVRPKPSIRVLGLFAARDTFVATNWALRGPLGHFDAAKWRAAKRRALAVWRHLFGGCEPIRETDPKTFTTGAIDGKYFK